MRHALLVEDEAPVRNGLFALLERARPDIAVTCCATAAEVHRVLEKGTKFDLALVDLRLPDGDGLDVISEIATAQPHVHILVLTKFADPADIVAAMRKGAVGYLLKHTPRSRILQALDEVAVGGAPMSPEIARKLVESMRPRAAADDDSGLTSREHEVLVELARGARYQDIASHLGVGESTVQSHIKSIYKKLRVTSKAAATREALRRRLVD